MPITKTELKKVHEMFSKCGPFFIALGDSVRQKLLLDIADAGENGISVMDLTAKSNLSRPAISHHLKILKDSGFLKSEKKGTWVFYKIAITENFEEIGRLVTETLKIIERVRKQAKKSGR
ncbi:ArsR/SmtB family transcription factor [Treponema sp.]|uniref:ArsR/SmtB family transcription factor n=1 Tax=Treponema sp. TaxID=166 RepID=UPI003F0D4B3C